MNISKYLTTILFIAIIFVSCDPYEDRLYSFDDLSAPANVSAVVNVTSDNSGLVTVIPNAEGATSFEVTFGDSADVPASIYEVGEEISHIYPEGTFTLSLIGVGINGDKSEPYTTSITVTFDPPENLEVTVGNDLEISRQVNISATADYASVIDFYFGESADEVPSTVEPGVTVNYLYAAVGEYTIRVVARNSGSATIDTSFTHTVIEITGPQDAAPTPAARAVGDVLSIFSDAYTDVTGTNFNPDWGQSTVVSTEDINGDAVLKYVNLNYQGTTLESAIDASSMEYLHVDIWTEDATELNIFPISSGPAEKAYTFAITAGQWVSYDIPLSEFSDVVDMADVFQFKFDGTAGSTVYIDNLYFYKGSGSAESLSLPLDFESSSTAYEWSGFDGGEVTIIDNPQSSGINTSSKVGQMVKGSGQTWGGSWIAMDAPIDFSTNKTFKMKVFATKADVKVLLKVENANDAGTAYEQELTMTVANDWEELSFDYSGIDDTKEYQKIVLIFDNGTAGDGSADFTYLFDDIVLTN